MAPMIPDSGGGDESAEGALTATAPVSRISGMADGSGTRLMMAGLIVAFIGLCIVLIKVLRVPEYWVPLMVGGGLFLLGFIRWMTSRNSRAGRRGGPPGA